MKKTKKPRRRKRLPTVYIPPSQVAEFPEVKGKTIEELKLHLELDDTTVGVLFTDKTYFSFDLEPGLAIRAFLYEPDTKDSLPTKAWPPLHRSSSWVKEPAVRKSRR